MYWEFFPDGEQVKFLYKSFEIVNKRYKKGKKTENLYMLDCIFFARIILCNTS